MYYTTMVGRHQSKTVRDVINYVEENRIMDSEALLAVCADIFKINPEISTTQVPPFAHPIFIKGLKPITVIDTRPYESPRHSNQRGIDDLVSKAQLTHLWNINPGDFTPVMGVLASGFSEWVCGAIRQHYAPEDREYEALRIIFICYYRMLSFSNKEMGHMELDDLEAILERLVARELRIPKVLYAEVMDTKEFKDYLMAIIRLKKISDNETDKTHLLRSTFDLIHSLIDNPGLRFSEASMVELVANGSWNSRDGKEIASAALDYPPYLLYMMFNALTVGIYRKTRIGRALASLKQRRVNVSILENWMREITEEF